MRYRSVKKCVFLCWIFISIQSYGQQEPRFLLRPACNQYCDDVSKVIISYDDFVGENLFYELSYLENEILNILEKYEYKEKIEIEKYNARSFSRWKNISLDNVKIDFALSDVDIGDNKKLFWIRMTTPSGGYSDVFSCENDQEKKLMKSCVINNFSGFIDKIIDGFLFKRSILNTEYAN